MGCLAVVKCLLMGTALTRLCRTFYLSSLIFHDILWYRINLVFFAFLSLLVWEDSGKRMRKKAISFTGFRPIQVCTEEGGTKEQ